MSTIAPADESSEAGAGTIPAEQVARIDSLARALDIDTPEKPVPQPQPRIPEECVIEPFEMSGNEEDDQPANQEISALASIPPAPAGNGAHDGVGFEAGPDAAQDTQPSVATGSMTAMLQGTDENSKIDLEKTATDLRSWPVLWRGYLDMFLYFVFIGLYLSILVVQLRIETNYALDEALRSIVDEGGDLQDVSTHGDFFDYLNKPIMENLFPSGWYNGDPFPTSDRGFIHQYNKLVGGILIVQQRGLEKRPCRKPMYSSFQSSYRFFYPVCYTEDKIEDTIDPSLLVQADPTTPNLNVPWRIENGITIAAPPSSPKDVNATIGNTTLKSFWQSFTYTPEYKGFAAFLALADSAQFNIAKVAALKEFFWLDRYTRQVNIKFALYNGNDRLFTYVNIQFGYPTTGNYLPFGVKGGTKVTVKSINMEPYFTYQAADGGKWHPDYGQIFLEVVFAIWVFYNGFALFGEGVNILFSEGLRGKRAEDEFGEETFSGGLYRFLLDKWTILEAVNSVLFVIYIGLRCNLVRDILNQENIIQVPSNKYESVLEDFTARIDTMKIGNFFNVLLSLFKCFKFYRFQPRLAIINKTIEICLSDFFHFMLMFCTFLFGFGVMAHIRFGSVMGAEFANLWDAIMTIFMMMLGAGLDFAHLAYIDGILGGVFFLSFMFLFNIILLNVLLAILVDSYVLAKEKTVSAFDGDEDSIPSIAGDLWTIFSHLTAYGAVDNVVLLVAVESLIDQGLEEATALEVFKAIPNDVRDKKKLTVDSVLQNGGLHQVEEEQEEQEEDEPELTRIKSSRLRSDKEAEEDEEDDMNVIPDSTKAQSLEEKGKNKEDKRIHAAVLEMMEENIRLHKLLAERMEAKVASLNGANGNGANGSNVASL